MNSAFSTILPRVACLALAAGALTACGGQSAASELGTDFTDVEQRAAAEGELVVYSAATEDVNAALVEAFNQEYPDISVTMTRLSTGDLRSRFASETSIGAQSADAVIVTDPLMFNQDPDWFLGLNEDVVPNLADVREGFAHDAHVGLVTSPWVLTYNTNKISSAPQSWKELENPEFLKDATLTDPQVASDSVLSFYQLLLDEYGAGYLKNLGDGNDDWFDSSVSAIQKVAAGQVALSAPGAKGHSQTLVNSGAPLGVVIPEPVFAFTNQLGVAADATHPNAALVFTNFMLSPAGQSAFCGDGLYLSLVVGDVEGCSPTPDDARIADPLRAVNERDTILSAFELD